MLRPLQNVWRRKFTALRALFVMSKESPNHRSFASWQTHTVASVVKTHAGIDLRGDETVDELRDKIAAAGFRIPSPSRTDSAGNPLLRLG